MSSREVGRAKVMGSLGDGRYARWLEERMMLGLEEEGTAFDGEATECGRTTEAQKSSRGMQDRSMSYGYRQDRWH